MDELLMRHGAERLCPDCHDSTIFLPVDFGADQRSNEWVCTACDGALWIGLAAA